MDVRAFERWGGAAAVAAAESLVARLPERSRPELGREGGPRTTQPGYRSAFVRASFGRRGRLAVWLFAVPPAHEYSVSRTEAKLGAGILAGDLRALAPTALRRPIGGRVQLFRWLCTLNGWCSHLTYIEADPREPASDAGAALAERSMDGLERLGLLE